MAENQQDESQKTEEPTQRRLEDAREKGQVATSREVNHWFLILAATVIVAMIMPSAGGDVTYTLAGFVHHAHEIPATPSRLGLAITSAMAELAFAMMPMIALLVAAAVLAGLIQNGPVFSVEQIKPKLERISLINGIKKLFSLRSLAEFAKGILKLAIVAGVLLFLVLPEFDRLQALASLPVPDMLAHMGDMSTLLMVGVLSVMTVIAGFDLFYQRFEHHKKMRMSRQELKDEMKQSEGDPIVKGRLRQLRMERARRRMMAAVPEADVVITNPSHFAVALQYEQETMRAPMVVAKGLDSLAVRIREIAKDNDVPVVENPPLARALHGAVEVGEEIPTEHYRAVAEIIGYVMGLKRKYAAS